MNGSHVQEHLSAFLDGELSEQDCIEVQRHLEICPICQKEREDLEKTRLLLTSLEEMAPPAGFRLELRHKLEKELIKERGFMMSLLERCKNLKRPVLIPTLVALALIVVMVPVLLVSQLVGGGVSKLAQNETYDRVGGAAGAMSKESIRDMDIAMDSGYQGSAPMAVPAPDAAMSTRVQKTKQEASVENKMMAPQEPTGGIVGQAIERKIIKNAELALLVDDYQAAANTLKNKVMAMGGYLASENVNTQGPQEIPSGHLQIRLPASRFEEFLAGMDGVGKVTARNVYAQDVTEEYIDVESNLKVMRVKEERLLDILSKSGKLSDLLAVENELANTRARLESLEGRLRYLNNRTDFSSIGIFIEQKAIPTQQISTTGFSGLWQRISEAFITAINNILKGTGNLVVFMSAAIPYFLIVGLFVWGLWVVVKRKKAQ